MIRIAILLGRLSNEAQADHGKVFHAVAMKKTKRPPCHFNDWGKKIIENDDFEAPIALCNAKPGRRSIGWRYEGGEVTCEKCLKKLQKLQAKKT